MLLGREATCSLTVRALDKQTILITGATDGLGRAVARELAAGGATVLIHGRDERRGRQTLEEIANEIENGQLHWLRADLASLDEVRGLVDQLIAEYGELHALVNNAGIGTTLPGDGQRMVSRDGYELRFAVNYLAGYLLTRRLLALLERSADASLEPTRIISVSSAGQAPIDFDDVMLERHYDGVKAYCQSKLAQVMFTLDLASELDRQRVTATCLHPGTYLPTKMVRAAGVTPITALDDGVRATVRLIADPQLDGVTGRYFNGTREAEPHPQSHDPEARRRLRQLSDELCGL
jgi:NAD(P)-dependent dehydrogenase (short-subunit alcohol dehydrogenase family)